MTSRDFCYWLQGHFEIGNATALGTRETEMIKRHLAMVFTHEIDPSFPDLELLKEIHSQKQPTYCEPEREIKITC